MFTFDTPRPRRKPSLTPMIDVVFLLLVFFMLAARFGMDTALPLIAAGSGEAYSGPPRLVDVAPDGLALNGVSMPLDALVARLDTMTEAPTDMIVLRPAADTDLQRAVDVMLAMNAAGHARVVMVAAP
ncbi:biopolymer transport protein ExbD [Loktanella atrilutea]|uniref:Biopolymer transport protein ExbD n=1 Tax=Loktanella atrilutea TaxID=366533 RepID=A0A1M4XJE8_LOKAT|nr:biopolymer transporter ExbD [Loktanella atrilutea]SHE93531.1 biopolymer transport protein ExbD [Loktanella atrilutea]